MAKISTVHFPHWKNASDSPQSLREQCHSFKTETKKTAFRLELKCVFAHVIITDVITEKLSGILHITALQLKVIHYCNGVAAEQILLLAWHYEWNFII